MFILIMISAVQIEDERIKFYQVFKIFYLSSSIYEHVDVYYYFIMKMLLKVNMCDEDNKQPRMSKQFELSLKTRIIFKFIERLIA